MILSFILCNIARHCLASFLFFIKFSGNINAFLLLVLFLEVYKEDTLNQILIHPHLCMFVLRKHLQEDFRLNLYVCQLLAISGHLGYPY